MEKEEKKIELKEEELEVVNGGTILEKKRAVGNVVKEGKKIEGNDVITGATPLV